MLLWVLIIYQGACDLAWGESWALFPVCNWYTFLLFPAVNLMRLTFVFFSPIWLPFPLFPSAGSLNGASVCANRPLPAFASGSWGFTDGSQLSRPVGCLGENQHPLMPVGGTCRLRSVEGKGGRAEFLKISVDCKKQYWNNGALRSRKKAWRLPRNEKQTDELDICYLPRLPL